MTDKIGNKENSKLATNRDLFAVVDNIESLINVIRGQEPNIHSAMPLNRRCGYF